MRIYEITTKTALVRSRIEGVDFVINPYLGCSHACRYCYAVFMKKYSRHNPDTPWGEFVEVKTNLVEVLRQELRRRRKTATAHLSSVCDPYQPVERKYRLTRGCLEALREFGWGIDILTRSPLVMRDADLLRSCLEASVGMSVGTDDDGVRRILEPNAPTIMTRVHTLERLRTAGIKTWAFISPMLPMNPQRLHELLAPHVDSVMFDALNYQEQVRAVFRSHGWAYALERTYAEETEAALRRLFGEKTE